MSLSLCAACRLPARSGITNLPCPECLDSLLRSPAICAECLGLACPAEECTRPWLAVTGRAGELRFDSVRAAYLSIGPGARVLKSWKTAPSPSLTRFLGRGVRDGLKDFPTDASFAIVPVPQSAARRWELEGGSTLRLVDMIHEARRNPNDVLLSLLEVGKSETLGTPSQARTRGGERYTRRSPIRSRKGGDALPLPERILLVDDFLTSGATLRSAARATRAKLTELGVNGRIRIDVFVLGFRPALFGENRK